MKKLFLFLCFAVGTIEPLTADAPPPYIQTQIENLNLQIQELNLQKKELLKQLEASDLPELQKNQYQAQIAQLETQIQFLEQQKARLVQENI